ncbi:Cyclic-di-GMP-binding biofilm dispersal mediator protein [Thalassocella blandensis]|nr:Cyclic-di-GMP-binding biofilm dispersal mediator protein [Thalassocella blandensis]
MSKTLQGQVALVTGGSRGLGSAIVTKLASMGADIAFSYVSSDTKAAEVVEKIEKMGSRVIAIKSDQADPASAKPLVKRVIDTFGKLDILINNAAIAVQGQTIDDPNLDTENLDRQWQINVMGTIANTRAAAPVLSTGGKIIFIGSLLGTHVPFSGAADYAGTKAALTAYAKGVARDLGGKNITVNVIQPGVMPTDMAKDVLGDGVPDQLLDLHPIRRIATLEEVTSLVGFIASPDAGYMTGGIIDIAGGLSI